MTDFTAIKVDVDHGVMTVTLNRPDKLNAMNTAMLDEVILAIDMADDDDAVRAVVFTGAGRGFCAGADLSRGEDTFDGAKRPQDANPMRDGGGRMALRFFESKKPLIAACNGPAVGVGSTMQCAMDVRLASTEARYGFVFTRRGVVMEACSSWFLPRVAPLARGMEWVMTGRVFGAQEAHEGGFVSAVYEPEDLLPAARKLALEVAENTSAVSVALCRQLMLTGLTNHHPMLNHKLESATLQGYMGGREDAREGVMSFLEKRAPHFPMRVTKDMPNFYPWRQTPPFAEG
ncbi:MAG: enoyl-CoA hydratase-related protein [Alphaproteobacteria bacterium]